MVLLISSCNGNNDPVGSQEDISTSNEESNSNEEIAETSTQTTPEPRTPPSPSELCQDVQISESDQPVTLSNLQFYRSPPNPINFDDSLGSNFGTDSDEDNLIGCVTNHSQDPLAGIHLEISYNEGNAYGAGIANSPNQEIPPSETVPFRHSIGIDSDTQTVTINKVTTLEPTATEGFSEPLESFNLEKTVTYVPATIPSVESIEQLCADVKPTQSDQPLEVNNLQIYDPPQDPYNFGFARESVLVGCITNYSNEPLHSLGMSYSSNGTGLGGATVEIPVKEIPSKQTVVFRKFGSLSADTEFIVIHSIGGNSGEVELDVTVNR